MTKTILYLIITIVLLLSCIILGVLYRKANKKIKELKSITDNVRSPFIEYVSLGRPVTLAFSRYIPKEEVLELDDEIINTVRRDLLSKNIDELAKHVEWRCEYNERMRAYKETGYLRILEAGIHET